MMFLLICLKVNNYPKLFIKLSIKSVKSQEKDIVPMHADRHAVVSIYCALDNMKIHLYEKRTY